MLYSFLDFWWYVPMNRKFKIKLMYSAYYLTLNLQHIQIYNAFNFIQFKNISSNKFSEVLIMKKKKL